MLRATGSAKTIDPLCISGKKRLITTEPVNIVSGEFKADPFSFLARLRASDPVYRTALPDKTPVWLLARYDDVTALLRDEQFTKNRCSALTKEQLRNNSESNRQRHPCPHREPGGDEKASEGTLTGKAG